MTPIERCSEKTHALSVLGLPKSATTADIRAAYKRLVLEKHPDHGQGSGEEFAAINDAYRFLKANADELGIRDAVARPRRVTSRPEIRPTETRFSDDVLAECASCLTGDAEGAGHVSTMLHRLGRKLTYFVPAAPAQGHNDVVVPTGELVDTRHAMPQVVPVEANQVSAGVYEVPADVCSTLFPGARSVQIRFAA